MFERFRRGRGDATAERTAETRHEDGVSHREGGVGHREVRARQRDEYGGINWGSAFFGWLVAVGMAAILTGIMSAAGAAVGLTEGPPSQSEATGNAETIGIVGGILLLVILAIAYYCGGYVSGRMSRFDGGRQGVAVWVIGLVVTLVIALLAAIAGSEYNVLARFDAPRIPVDEGTLTTGGIIALIAIVVVSILAAMAGGKAGERFHKKVDRVGLPG